MTQEEFKTLAKGMKAVYAGANFLPDTDSMRIWYRLLQDLPYELASTAVHRHMLTSKFPPTIADIREQCSNVSVTERKDWLEGWSQIGKVMSRYGYNRPAEAIEALKAYDETTGRVAEMLGWQNLCLSENPSADRANFRQCFETIQTREKETNQLPDAFNALVSGITEKLMIGASDGR